MKTLKVMACSRRRPGMTRSDYFRYLELEHGAISRKYNPGGILRKYIQNHVFDSAFGTLGDKTYTTVANRDACVELFFPDGFQQLYACFMDPDVEKYVASDGKHFADEPVTLLLIAEEEEKPVPNPGLGAVKVMHFLPKAEGVYMEAFVQYWGEAHEAALANVPLAAAQLRKYVQSVRLPQTDNVKAHFGAAAMPVYHGVASLWYDGVETLGAFRQYCDAFCGYPKAFVDWSNSFFLYTREVTIIGN